MIAEVRNIRPVGLATSLAAAVIIIAGLKAAGDIIILFLLGGFISILCAKPYVAMRNRGVPSWLAISLMMAVLVVAQGMFFSVIAKTVADFSQDLPMYQVKLDAAVTSLTSTANEYGIVISKEFIQENLDPTAGLAILSGLLGKIGGMASKGFLILILVLFALMEMGSLPTKMRIAFNDKAIAKIQDFVATVRTYVGIKAISSAVTAVLVYMLLAIMEVDYAILWAVTAFLLNFIPSIGSIIAAVPAIFLALVNGGPMDAAIVASAYVLINVTIGNVIEPKILGKGAGISALAVILSLVFWGWVFGTIGMLLAVPLTVLMKIALETSEDSRWIATMLGPCPSETEVDRGSHT